MALNFLKNTVLLFVMVLISCGSNSKQDQAKKNDMTDNDKVEKTIVVGANQTKNYLPLLNGKKVGMVANQTSVIFENKTDSIYEVNPETNEFYMKSISEIRI